MKFKIVFLMIGILLVTPFISSFDWYDGLVSFWSFEESSGAFALDNMSVNNGTLKNMENGDWVSGKVGQALALDGVDENINIGAGTSISFAGNRTIQAWFKIDGDSEADRHILSDWGGNYLIAILVNGSLQIENNAGAKRYTEFVSQNEWHHLVWTFDDTNDNSSVWLDGVVNMTYTDTGTGGATAINVSLGSIATSGYFNGTIDEMGIWNITLSNVDELWNEGNGLPFVIDYILVNLVYPQDNLNISDGNNEFIATLSPKGYDLTNATFYVWWNNGTLYDSEFNSVSGGTAINTTTTINMNTIANDYTWNVYGCQGDGGGVNCSYASSNYTFNVVEYSIISETYNATTTETFPEIFTLNISLSDGIYLNSASFIWNETSYSPLINSSGEYHYLSRVLIMPNITTQTNVSFFWQLDLTSGSVNLTSNNQTINALSIDNCAINTHTILNYSVYDEDARTFLNSTIWNITSSVYVKLSGDYGGDVYEYYSAIETTNPLEICVETALLSGQNYRLDAEIQYTGDDYVTEYHYIENYTLNSSTPVLNVSLYSLLVNRSQEFLITFKDINLLPVEGALVELSRQYLDIGGFLSVEILKTDNDGRTIGHFVLNDEIYTIYVKKDGVLLATFQNVRAFCSDVTTGDCRINLNQAGSTSNPSGFTNYLGVIGAQSYNDNTKVYTFTFTTEDSSTKTINVTILKFDQYLNETICSQQLISSSGTIVCTIPSNYYNSTALVKVFVDGELYASSIFDITISKAAELNSSRFLLAVFLIITIPFLAFTSGPMMLIFFVLGLIVAGGLVLIDWGGFIGPFSAFLWFVIAAIILLVKASKRREQ